MMWFAKRVTFALWGEITLFVEWISDSVWFVVRHPFHTCRLLICGFLAVARAVGQVVLVWSIIDGLSNRR